MKKKRNLLFVAMLFLLSSCVTFHSGLTSNLNNHTTEVVLSQNNYTVISSVKGEASAKYVFGIGGGKKALIAEAKTKMLAKADIVGKSRAIVNETVEVRTKNVFFITKYTVTVSAHIIEFTK
jgi:hypothetical protein